MKRENPMEAKRKHIIYTEEFRREAVEMVIHSGKTQAQVARELGCSEYSLNVWKKAYLRQQAPARDRRAAKKSGANVCGDPPTPEGKRVSQTAARDSKKSDEHPGRGTDSRYAMIKELSVDFDVKECCKALRVSRSGYYRWQNAEPSRREKENAELVEQIKEVFEANKSRYGSPRVTRELRQQGLKCGKSVSLA